MSGQRKKRWEKFGTNESSDTSSDDDCGIVLKQTNLKQSDSKEIRKKSRSSFTSVFQSIRGEGLPSLTQNRESPDNKTIGSTLPPHLRTHQSISGNTIGPALPPHLQTEPPSTSGSTVGPALPPHLQTEPQLTPGSTIGPALPPHLQTESQSTSGSTIGPALPPHLQTEPQLTPGSTIGPALPPHLQTESQSTSGSTIGPALPPHLQTEPQSTSGNTIGPALPPNTPALQRNERVVGPFLPPGFVIENDSDESSDDSGAIGPDPRLMVSADQPLNFDVAERAERSRRKMLGLDQVKQERESWMLELPPERAANIGLGARQFRAKLAPEMGDRTVWTDTPSDKVKKEGRPPKVDDKDLCRMQMIAERDRQMEKMARKAEKKLKRNESLLESHSKKLKKEAKEIAEKSKDEPQMRKMFSREDDMQVHRFDEAQKKAIFKKAQFLNDRFSQGESKFL